MAKFCGNIGYAIDKETSSKGVWVTEVIEKKYMGDVIRSTKRFEQSESVNDDINISNQISIISDPFSNENLGSIRYVVLRGTRWKVTDVELKYPRLILSIGGVYNGPIPK